MDYWYKTLIMHQPIKDIRMKNIFKFYLLIGIAALIYSCDDPYANETYQVYDMNPVSTYLESRSDEFSEWITVLKYADLFNAVNQATESFTVFVPENEAVQAFYKRKGVSSIQDLGQEYARNLAQYHIIGDSIPLETFIIGGKIEQRTLSDDYLSVTFNEAYEGEGGFNSVYVNKEARVTELAVRVSNGFVYVMDGVLNPLVEPVYDRISEAGIYNIFKEAVDMTSWKDSLSTIYDDVKQPSGATVKQKRDYTVLAVSDEDFKKDGINSMSDLIAKLGAETNYTDSENELFRYIAYHIIKGNYSLFDFQTFTGSGKKKMWGTVTDAVIEVSLEDDGKYYLNYDGDEVKAEFVEINSDIQAKNGMLHRLSAYLPIWESQIPVEVYFDFCDYPELATYISGNGIAGQVYQTAHASSEYRTEITDLSIFEVEITSPATPTTSFNYVDYFTVKASNNWNNAMNKDMLILNLGYMGSISMQTPVLIAGKYKVTLQVGYATSMNFMMSRNGGKMQFSFDGANRQEVAPMHTFSTNTLNVYQCTLYDELEFDKTGAHKLKIVIMDPDANTNSSFRIYLDYLHFEPIITE